MKLPILIVLAATQYSGAPVAPQSVRVAYANQLFIDTMTALFDGNEGPSNLEIEAKGEYQQILYIRDDSDTAKAFYLYMAGDEYTRANLLRMGFKMVVLVNAKHGTFVVDLMTNGLDKPETRGC